MAKTKLGGLSMKILCTLLFLFSTHAFGAGMDSFVANIINAEKFEVSSPIATERKPKLTKGANVVELTLTPADCRPVYLSLEQVALKNMDDDTFQFAPGETIFMQDTGSAVKYRQIKAGVTAEVDWPYEVALALALSAGQVCQDD